MIWTLLFPNSLRLRDNNLSFSVFNRSWRIAVKWGNNENEEMHDEYRMEML